MPEPPGFSIVMPTFRRPDALRDAVAAVAALDYPHDRFELIVVDDEGGHRAEGVLSTIDVGRLRISLESHAGGGAAAARNRGARRACFEQLLFLDDDILVSTDHLRRHAEHAVAYPGALVNGAWVFAPAVRMRLQETPFGRYRLDLERHFQDEAMGAVVGDGLIEMRLLGTWDLAVSRGLFEQLGGFDDGFPVAGAEDQDFSIRARESGARLLLDQKIVCLHNDDRVDLMSYCAREERSASTMPLLARKHPEQFGAAPYVVENSPLHRGDPRRLTVKKVAKGALSWGPVLSMLHRSISVAERCGAPDVVLRRSYALLLGLHLFRGFRSTYRP